MYASGKTQAEVAAMLLEEDANEQQVPSLAERFYQDYAFWLKEKRKKKRKDAERDILIGGVLVAAGIIFSLMSYLSIGGGQVVLFYGIAFVGVVFLVKGAVEQQHLKKEAQTEK
jgi:hypothetical protein